MITGFNTDVEHDGVVYHVQTEDKGLNSPLILSLVYAGGAILASKRSPYEDLIAAGFDEAALAKRLKRQHRLICAAINAGRIDELKRMSERPDQPAVAPPSGQLPTGAMANEADTVVAAEPVTAAIPLPPVEPQNVVPRPESAYTVYDSRRHSPLGEKTNDSGLSVRLLDEQPFRAGQQVTIKVLVERATAGQNEPVEEAKVSIKILGTAFRPQLFSMTTGRDGTAINSARIPHFTSGRAAVIIRVEAAGEASETRRVIHPAK